MPRPNPEGQPAPATGELPVQALSRGGGNSFSIYVHVPYCQTRCGYCDFNTYTAAELGPGASGEAYPAQAIAEIRLAARVLGNRRPVSTVFFGGGTPTVLPPRALGSVLHAIRAEFGFAPGIEITTEANPESVDQRVLADLAEVGFTRLSVGMQSAVPRVLAVLDRVHRPGRPERCVAWAREAGFGQVSIDLIYGTPGEKAADWLLSLRRAMDAGPDHISAYALIVEEGTRLAARIRRGELSAPDGDVMADRYLAADDLLAAAGYGWYEISNWARGDAARCRHNLAYWVGGDWWGIGPGAHSHVGGVRWWNVRHPAAYAARVAAGLSPAQGREILTAEQRQTERIMLATRLSAGCPISLLSARGRAAAERAAADGLASAAALGSGRVVLTRRGRLLADTVIRAVTD